MVTTIHPARWVRGYGPQDSRVDEVVNYVRARLEPDPDVVMERLSRRADEADERRAAALRRLAPQ